MKLHLALALVITVLVTATTTFASEYPAKPIRIIAQFTPGTSTDILARIIAQKMGEHWNQQVVVDNRPGAGNAADSLAESPLAGSGVGAPVK